MPTGESGHSHQIFRDLGEFVGKLGDRQHQARVTSGQNSVRVSLIHDAGLNSNYAFITGVPRSLHRPHWEVFGPFQCSSAKVASPDFQILNSSRWPMGVIIQKSSSTWAVSRRQAFHWAGRFTLKTSTRRHGTFRWSSKRISFHPRGSQRSRFLQSSVHGNLVLPPSQGILDSALIRYLWGIP